VDEKFDWAEKEARKLVDKLCYVPFDNSLAMMCLKGNDACPCRERIAAALRAAKSEGSRATP
jgi:hypothetical protein